MPTSKTRANLCGLPGFLLIAWHWPHSRKATKDWVGKISLTIEIPLPKEVS